MTPGRWELISKILNDALDRPIAQRTTFLTTACGTDHELRREVESLLASHEQAGSFVPGPFGGQRAQALEQMAHAELGLFAGTDRDPEQVGLYRVEGRIGEGGMGTVYRASRADRVFEKRVAIKILRSDLADDELIQRFRGERQILARLEHPNIARLLDGGTTDNGRPYLVMEYVEGRPIDRYCEEEGASLEERLGLFRKICAAVHVAHQNLVVHRDLKPANILVGEDGEPKLLDFGIAKLLRPESLGQTLVSTQPGMSPLTLSHASPEQIRGRPVTTASDVYSLGVVLFQLLAGRLPYDASDGSDLHRIAGQICDLEPPRPSSVAAPEPRWRRRLPFDLEMIVLKALRKEAGHRYASVEQLANDLERYSKGLPVRAQGDALRYRAGKFLRRHHLWVAAATLIVVLVAGFIATLLVQRQKIVREQRSAQEVARLMVDLFESNDPDRALGERLTVRELLDRGARSMEVRLIDDPELRATLLGTLGQVYRNMGLLAEAEPFLKETLDLRREMLGPGHPLVADTLRQLADRDRLAGNYDTALQGYQQASEILGERASASLALTLQGQAATLQANGDLEAAAATFDRGLEVARQALGGEDPVLAQILVGRAGLEQQRGEFATAQQHFEAALEIYRQTHGERHSKVADTLQRIALVLADRHLFEQSDALFEQALALQRQLYDGHHPILASTLDSLATSLVDRGQLDRAEPLAREALDMRRLAYGPEHSRVARSINLLGLIRANQGRNEEAEALLRQAVEMWRQLHGPDHHEMTPSLGNLGELLVRTQRLEEGAQHLREAIRISHLVYGEGHIQAAMLSTTLGMVLKRQGDLVSAEQLYRQSLPVLEEAFGQRHARVATVRQNLGAVLLAAERLPEAEVEIRQALASFRAVYGNENRYVAVTLKNLARVLRDQGQAQEAETVIREALEIYAEIVPDDHPGVVLARKVLASLLETQGV